MFEGMPKTKIFDIHNLVQIYGINFVQYDDIDKKIQRGLFEVCTYIEKFTAISRLDGVRKIK